MFGPLAAEGHDWSPESLGTLGSRSISGTIVLLFGYRRDLRQLRLGQTTHPHIAESYRGSNFEERPHKKGVPSKQDVSIRLLSP